MDLTSTGGIIAITIFRLLHIVAGVIWVGAGVLVSMYLEPALERSGVDTTKFMRALYTRTGYTKLMPAVAITTTVAGVILYWMVTNGFSDVDFMRSGKGIVLGIGALIGLLAFGHGGGAMGRMTGQYVEMLNEAGDDPTGEQQQSLTELEGKLRRHGRISMWLAVAAVVFMAGARYIQ